MLATHALAEHYRDSPLTSSECHFQKGPLLLLTMTDDASRPPTVPPLIRVNP